MIEDITKNFVVPLDGSKNSLRSLSFLMHQFGIDYDLKIALLHILPGLPAILVEESASDSETEQKLWAFQEKNKLVAEKLLSDAKRILLQRGYPETRVKSDLQKRKVGIARDICAWSTGHQVDAIAISSSGRSQLEGFFVGEIAHKLVEFCRAAPVWLVKGKSRNRNALLAIDDSENAMRAADYTGSILAGTSCRITLFHSRYQLTRRVASELIDEFPAIEERWKHAAIENLSPYLKKARDRLAAAGIPEQQLEIKVVEGTISVADDILKEAARGDAGTVILGCKGHTNAEEYAIGSVTKKVVIKAEDITVCTVP